MAKKTPPATPEYQSTNDADRAIDRVLERLDRLWVALDAGVVSLRGQREELKKIGAEQDAIKRGQRLLAKRMRDPRAKKGA